MSELSGLATTRARSRTAPGTASPASVYSAPVTDHPLDVIITTLSMSTPDTVMNMPALSGTAAPPISVVVRIENLYSPGARPVILNVPSPATVVPIDDIENV